MMSFLVDWTGFNKKIEVLWMIYLLDTKLSSFIRKEITF